jgi:hypothetical protein
VPPSVQHDDLHDANVFVADGRHRFFDWGDASVAHPFLSLLVPLRVAAQRWGCRTGTASLLRLRDAYLEPWSAYGSPAELREQCAVALPGGPAAAGDDLARASCAACTRPSGTEWQNAVPGWTAEYLEPPGLDRAP